MAWTVSRSLRMKLIVMALAALAFIVIYEQVIPDSRQARLDSASETAAPTPGGTVRFQVTAYCKGTTTASGVRVKAGMAAADPKVLPLGSVIRIEGVPAKYEGIYTVLDTGPAVQGRILDIYMWSCYEALDFGRRRAAVTVLRLGWDPETSVQ
ncbi:MAG: 3D domain-containing protein [Acidobacteria bacterium]|nr:3D domain-containing protein [Acidobacteriota bacterium]